jgi:ABC-type hemin transport system substrate-binding protein
MKAIALALVTCLALTGCFETFKKKPQEKPETTVAERVEYVIKLPPASMLELPPPPPPIDVDVATQADVARWVLANEKWMNDMRNRLREIAAFLKDEQQNLDKLAKEFNEKQGTSGNASLVIKREEPKK